MSYTFEFLIFRNHPLKHHGDDLSYCSCCRVIGYVVFSEVETKAQHNGLQNNKKMLKLVIYASVQPEHNFNGFVFFEQKSFIFHAADCFKISNQEAGIYHMIY